MFIITDLETTGFSIEKNDVIQIAALAVDKELNIVSRFNEYLAPVNYKYWSYEAEKIHGIQLTEAMAFQSRKSAVIKFMNFLHPFIEQFPLTFVYHGRAYYDFRFLKSTFLKELLHEKFELAFTQEKVISTRDLCAKAFKADSYKLNDLCSTLGIELNHHEAMSDALACYELFKRYSDVGLGVQSLGF